MPRVYIVQEDHKKNFKAAEEFGEVSFLQPFGQVDIDIATRVIDAKLQDINEQDYLLLVGDPVLIAIAASLASDYLMGVYKVLRWDRKEAKYFPLTINLRTE